MYHVFTPSWCVISCAVCFSTRKQENNEKETGITIHYVNANYDEGAIIKQAKTIIESNDTVEHIASKVHQLEYEYFPKVIDEILLKQ